MTDNSARKGAVRAYMAAHDVSYSVARRHLYLQQTLSEPERLAFFSEFLAGPHPHALVVTGTHGGVGASSLGDRLAERSVELEQKAKFTILEGPVGSTTLPDKAQSPFVTRVLLVTPRKESLVGAKQLIRSAQDAGFYIVANVRAGEPRFADEALAEFYGESAYLGSLDLVDAVDTAVLDAILDLTERRIQVIDRALIRKIAPSEKAVWESRTVRGSDSADPAVLIGFTTSDPKPTYLDTSVLSAEDDAAVEVRAHPYPQMAPGQRVRFADDRRIWVVRRISEDGRNVVLTNGKSYSIIDFALGVRGPDDSYGTGYATDADIAESLGRLVAGDTKLSARHWAWLRYADSQPDGRTAVMLDALRASVEAIYLADAQYWALLRSASGVPGGDTASVSDELRSSVEAVYRNDPRRSNAIYKVPPSLLNSGRLPYVAPYDTRFAPEDRDLLIGAGPHDSVVRWVYARDAHLLVTGADRSGKTTALATIVISALANGFGIHIVEGRGRSRLAFARARAARYVSGPDGDPQTRHRVLAMLNDLLVEIQSRFERMAQEKVFLSSQLADPPAPVLIVIDDLDFLFPIGPPPNSDVDQQTRTDLGAGVAALRSCLRTGRAAGVHVLASTARLDALPAAMKVDFVSRLVTGVVADPDWSSRLPDPARAVPITGPSGEGRAVYQAAGPTTEVQVWWPGYENETLTAVMRRQKKK